MSNLDQYSKETKNFAARCAEVFKLPGETASEFMKGFKALTDQDKADLCKWFNDAGLPTDAPLVKAA